MKHLTLKQKIFIREYINTLGNATKASLLAYGCKSINVAGVVGYQNLRKLNIRREINKILDMGGITEDVVISNLNINVLSSRNIKSIKLALRLRGLI